jgi:hypothetical protein
MKRLPTPFDYMAPAMTMTRMLLEAQTVIALRMMGMAGVLPARPGETTRMVTEKVAAAQDAGVAMARAAMAGASPAAITSAGLKPVRRRTRANVARLTRRSK